MSNHRRLLGTMKQCELGWQFFIDLTGGSVSIFVFQCESASGRDEMGELSRRDFLKKSITTGTTLSVISLSGFSPFLFANIQCKKCGSKYTEFICSLTKPGCDGFCINCGAHLQTGIFVKEAKCKFTCGSDASHIKCGAPCMRVPFPNHALAIKTDKPYLNLSELRF